MRAWHCETLADMAELAARSSRGAAPVVVEGATHSSIVLQPEHAARVSEQIVEVVAAVRADVAGENADAEPPADG